MLCKMINLLLLYLMQESPENWAFWKERRGGRQNTTHHTTPYHHITPHTTTQHSTPHTHHTPPHHTKLHSITSHHTTTTPQHSTHTPNHPTQHNHPPHHTTSHTQHTTPQSNTHHITHPAHPILTRQAGACCADPSATNTSAPVAVFLPASISMAIYHSILDRLGLTPCGQRKTTR